MTKEERLWWQTVETLGFDRARHVRLYRAAELLAAIVVGHEIDSDARNEICIADKAAMSLGNATYDAVERRQAGPFQLVV